MGQLLSRDPTAFPSHQQPNYRGTFKYDAEFHGTYDLYLMMELPIGDAKIDNFLVARFAPDSKLYRNRSLRGKGTMKASGFSMIKPDEGRGGLAIDVSVTNRDFKVYCRWYSDEKTATGTFEFGGGKKGEFTIEKISHESEEISFNPSHS